MTTSEYPKIETLLDRDPQSFKVLPGHWRLPEFEYLKDLQWRWTEKVDGTNVRVMYVGGSVTFGGKSDAAQMPTFLLARLQSLFNPQLLAGVFPATDTGELPDVTLYGEGYGARIQKGGGNYNPSGVDYVLFDVRVGNWWLKWEDVQEIAGKLAIKAVPIIRCGILEEALQYAADGFESTWGHFKAEGLVVRPMVDLNTRSHQRLIGKIKTKDFTGGKS